MTNDTEISEVLRNIDTRLSRIETAVRDNSPPSIRPGRSYSRGEAARLLGVSVWTIDRARKYGLLHETRRLGPRNVRITGESILAYQRQREGQRQGADVLPL